MRIKFLVLAGAAALAASPAAAQDFAGPRVEASIGYDATHADDGVASTPNKLDGVRLGGAIGYDVAIGSIFTIGAEAGIGFDLGDSTELTAGNTKVRVTSGYDFDASLRLGARVGSRTLVYAKGGYANSEFRVRTTTGNAVTSVKDDEDGWRVGAGVEHLVTDNVYAKAEYRYTDYGDDVNRHQVLVGAGYRF